MPATRYTLDESGLEFNGGADWLYLQLGTRVWVWRCPRQRLRLKLTGFELQEFIKRRTG